MTSIGSLSISMADLQRQMFNKIDKNGDGKVTQDEFVDGRPKEVSESDAKALFTKLDKSNAGSLTEADFADMGPPPQLSNLDSSSLATLLQSQDQTASTAPDGGGDLTDLFGKIDADGDGKITKDEFVNARPKDISADQASSLFDKIDESGTGSVAEAQFVEGMQKNRPPGPGPGGPPPGGSASSDRTGTDGSDILSLLSSLNTSSGEESQSSASSSSANTAFDMLLKAIKSYAQSIETVKSTDLTSSLVAA